MFNLFHLFKAHAQGIIISSGTNLIQKEGVIATKVNWVNNGVYAQNAGSVVFNGNNQYIIGTSPTQFKNILIETGSNTTVLSNTTAVQSILKVNGNLNVNNNLTLLASANETALVDGTGTGNINGSLIAEAYLQNGIGYKYLGVPFQNSTVSQFAPWVNLSSSFPSVFSNNEDVLSNGWKIYTDPNNNLTPMEGYAFHFGYSLTPKKIYLNGIVNNGAYTLNIQNHNNPYTKGFHLVSNPYPSPINWDAVAGWTKINIDNAIYYFDADSSDVYGGVYNTYINGISSNGIANNLIPSFQGFFVHVTDGAYPVSGTLSVNNQARVLPPLGKYRKVNTLDEKSFIRLSFASKQNEKKDFAVAYINEQLVNNGKNADAIKLQNTSTAYPNIYFIDNAQQLAIHSINQVDSTIQIPIGISVNNNGVYVFGNQIINANSTIKHYYYLLDRVSNKVFDLTTDLTQEVYLNSGVTQTRFELIVSSNPIMQQATTLESNTIDNTFSVYSKQGTIYLNKYLTEHANIVVSNVIGEKVYERSLSNAGLYPLNIPHLSGVYFISYINAKGISTKKIIITE